LLSLIPPVNGDFAPRESRPELAAGVPDNNPGAKTNLLYLPKGWDVAGTSFKIIFEVRARPPSPANSSAGVSNEYVFSLVLILKICDMWCLLLESVLLIGQPFFTIHCLKFWPRFTQLYILKFRKFHVNYLKSLIFFNPYICYPLRLPVHKGVAYKKIITNTDKFRH
jgi:hypothetical protein